MCYYSRERKFPCLYSSTIQLHLSAFAEENDLLVFQAVLQTAADWQPRTTRAVNAPLMASCTNLTRFSSARLEPKHDIHQRLQEVRRPWSSVLSSSPASSSTSNNAYVSFLAPKQQFVWHLRFLWPFSNIARRKITLKTFLYLFNSYELINLGLVSGWEKFVEARRHSQSCLLWREFLCIILYGQQTGNRKYFVAKISLKRQSL